VFAVAANSPDSQKFSLQLTHLEVMLGACALPALLAIAGTQVVSQQLARLEAHSTEIFRGQRLPLLPFPPAEN
jgi:hypothetical protein